jgi:hypothetical protein
MSRDGEIIRNNGMLDVINIDRGPIRMLFQCRCSDKAAAARG